MTFKFPHDDNLFTECIQALNNQVIIMSKIETAEIWKLFKSKVPITTWGRVDWSMIERKIEIGYEPEDIIPALITLKQPIDMTIYVLWNDASVPIIKTNLNAVVANYNDVIALETWFFNPRDGYVIEVLNDCSITVGLI
ncbi:MAG: hypothetical protein BWY54_00611 [Candidatus Dependentiae bacterium ADurb.Bin331]|nr:MAG: hypothetical protein BWY54_00611 [Candidatus Dependentiae bacterium ADurb.Bin331]